MAFSITVPYIQVYLYCGKPGAAGALGASAGIAHMVSDVSSPVSSTEYNTPYSRIDSGISPSDVSQTDVLQAPILQAAILRDDDIQNER